MGKAGGRRTPTESEVFAIKATAIIRECDGNIMSRMTQWFCCSLINSLLECCVLSNILEEEGTETNQRYHQKGG